MRTEGWVSHKERAELEKVLGTRSGRTRRPHCVRGGESAEFAMPIAKGNGLLWNNVGPDGVGSMMKEYP